MSSASPESALPATGPAAHNFHDANFPVDEEGRVYHLGVRKGEVANRIISVGSESRAAVIAAFLDSPEKTFVRRSNRGFVVYTGTKSGIPITIIATGMGTAMMDFLVRETRAVVVGPMVIIRYGTCGTPSPKIPVGSIAIASEGSVMVSTDYDAHDSTDFMYRVSKPVPSDPELAEMLYRKMTGVFGEERIVRGLNATGDSFYSSQGRHDDNFDDRNDRVVDALVERHPDLITIEMETFMLFYLARISRGTIRASATTMVLAQRRSNDFLDKPTMMKLEREGGRAILDALAELPLDGIMAGPECVWSQ